MTRSEFKMNLVRRFEGFEYTLAKTFGKKADAKRAAAYYRRQGHNARIVVRKSQKKKYAVFVGMKKKNRRPK